MDKNEGNFLDSKTILAIILVGVVWFSWQSYLSKKYPQMNQPKTAPVQEVKNETIPNNSSKTVVANQAPKTTENISEESLFVELESSKGKVSSLGLGFKDIELTKFKDRNKAPIKFGSNTNDALFELSTVGRSQKLNFSLNKKEDTVFGTAKDGNILVERVINVKPETYSYLNKVRVSNIDPTFKGITVLLTEKIQEEQPSSFLMPSYEHQEFVVLYDGGKEERVNITATTENFSKTFQKVSLIGVGSQYFTTAISDHSDIIPEVTFTIDYAARLAKLELVYRPVSLKDSFDFSFITYAGPKDQKILLSADAPLAKLINLGFFSTIGNILLNILKWFYQFVGNWGYAIILLTILVRIIVLPFNIASYKSMKKMQKIQPMMQSLRERYKDDPQALNREMMTLMKENKVNPLGGCLPMLLQMPVFFALFQVLGNSIELYQAPFILWIHDLSLKDPFYVLPVLMGITFWIQQKITPTTMDPTQAKVMQFMPILFSLMMVSLPSGLTLYTFVSTLFGVVQQQLFTRDRTVNHSVNPVKV